MTEIRVPTLGESVTEATIGRWFKKAGEAVKVDEPLVSSPALTAAAPAPRAPFFKNERRFASCLMPLPEFSIAFLPL